MRNRPASLSAFFAVNSNSTAFPKLLILLIGMLGTSMNAEGQLCTPPAPHSKCTPPSSFDKDVVVPAGTTVTWQSLGLGKPDEVTNKIRISGGGTVIVQNGDLLLKSSGAVLNLEGVEFIVNNGNLKLDEVSSRFIQNGGALRTYGNFQQKENSVICITDTDIEIGDEEADGQFNTTGNNSTSANWQNDGGYRYLENNCINVTHDYQLESSGSGSGTNGVDVIINCCFEIGDRGPNHATPTPFGVSDGDDSGNWQSSNTQSIYGTDIVVANGDYQNSNATMTMCDVDVKLNKSGNFQNQSSGTIVGENLCLAVEDILENSGTWTASIDDWYSDKNNSTNVPGAGSETAESTILTECFENNCCDEICICPPLTLICPPDTTIESCKSQAEINAAFAAWKLGVVVAGGCSPQLSVSPELAPPACGGSFIVTFTVTDVCEPTSCTATFSVAPAPDLTVECPDDVNIPECTSAEEIQDAFDDWLDGFSHSGGCDPQENALPTTPPDECDGGMIVFEYEVTDD